jgi:lipopolysaccharide/colanic/teichoic acid biosynthesis glycosyltransferase
LDAPRLGAEVVGFLDDREAPGHLVRCRVSQMHGQEVEARVLGSGRDLARVAHETRATELCIAIPDLTSARLERLREEAEALGLELGIVPRFGDLRPDQLVVEDIGAVPVLRFNRPRSGRFQLAAKRAVDIVGVLALAPIAIPLGLLVAAAVRFDGKPVLFRQTRIGRDGRPFTLLKFRTMSTRVAPYENSPTDLSDPRLTRVGRIIRLAGVDELPQLLNVLKGEMSLVGPRPEMPQIVARYGDVERSRLSTRPGLTGIWQLSPDRSQAIHDNLEYDLYYLSRNSLILDFLILGETLVFFARALGSSIAEGFRKLDLEVFYRALDPRTLRNRRTRTGAETPRQLVFVALDQRRRPDEPVSWSRCVPRVSSLGSSCAVKLLAASANRNRFSELAPTSSANGDATGLEFVPYEPDSVRLLATEADCVVTDLGHIAEWAFGAGVPTFLIRSKEGDLEIGTNGSESSLAGVVRSALAGATPGSPAIA